MIVFAVYFTTIFVLFIIIILERMKNQISVKVVKGNILGVKAQGMVVPQFADKMSLTGVAGALVSCGHYCGVHDYALAARQAKLPFGYSFTTDGAEGLKMLNVSVLGVPVGEAFNIMQLATYAALTEAEKCGLSTVAMPALGTGQSGSLSFKQSAKAMLSAIEVYGEQHPQSSLRKIVICLFKSESAFKVYNEVACKKNYRRYLNRELKIWNDANRRNMMM